MFESLTFGSWAHASATDGGVWLRANEDRSLGVLLIWHVPSDFTTIVNPTAQGLFSPDDEIHLRVVVKGNTYSAYLNGSLDPVDCANRQYLSSGFVGLYDYSGVASEQRFEKALLAAVPEPSTLLLVAAGLIVATRRTLRS